MAVYDFVYKNRLDLLKHTTIKVNEKWKKVIEIRRKENEELIRENKIKLTVKKNTFFLIFEPKTNDGICGYKINNNLEFLKLEIVFWNDGWEKITTKELLKREFEKILNNNDEQDTFDLTHYKFGNLTTDRSIGLMITDSDDLVMLRSFETMEQLEAMLLVMLEDEYFEPEFLYQLNFFNT